MEDLERIGSPEVILAMEQASDSEDWEAEADGEIGHETKEFEVYTLTKVLSHRAGNPNPVDNGEADTRTKCQPKKSTEDEKREFGSIKLDVYGDYFFKSGGFKVRVLLIMIFVCFMGLIRAMLSWCFLQHNFDSRLQIFLPHPVITCISWLVKALRKMNADFEIVMVG